MTLRAAVITREGSLEEEAEIGARVCDCCQTAAVRTDRGALVAYSCASSRTTRQHPIRSIRADVAAVTGARP